VALEQPPLTIAMGSHPVVDLGDFLGDAGGLRAQALGRRVRRAQLLDQVADGGVVAGGRQHVARRRREHGVGALLEERAGGGVAWPEFDGVEEPDGNVDGDGRIAAVAEGRERVDGAEQMQPRLPCRRLAALPGVGVEARSRPPSACAIGTDRDEWSSGSRGVHRHQATELAVGRAVRP
jgi:hypothetical protein